MYLAFERSIAVSELKLLCNLRYNRIPVADPGFPVRGAWSPEAATFSKICMSKRKNWVPWGRTPGAPPGSANEYQHQILWPGGVVIKISKAKALNIV